MEYSLNDKYELITLELLKSKSRNPIEIVRDIMDKPFINMHGPEHHYLDGGAFLAAYHNCVKDFDLVTALETLRKRSINMPGAMCGQWGVCGSVSSIGAALAIIHNTGPLSDDQYYKQHMKFTSEVLAKMSEIGGPRCCKRNAFISISSGILYLKQYCGIEMEESEIKCCYSSFNKQCIGKRCPFNS